MLTLLKIVEIWVKVWYKGVKIARNSLKIAENYLKVSENFKMLEEKFSKLIKSVKMGGNLTKICKKKLLKIIRIWVKNLRKMGKNCKILIKN